MKDEDEDVERGHKQTFTRRLKKAPGMAVEQCRIRGCPFCGRLEDGLCPDHQYREESAMTMDLGPQLLRNDFRPPTF